MLRNTRLTVQDSLRLIFFDRGRRLYHFGVDILLQHVLFRPAAGLASISIIKYPAALAQLAFLFWIKSFLALSRQPSIFPSTRLWSTSILARSRKVRYGLFILERMLPLALHVLSLISQLEALQSGRFGLSTLDQQFFHAVP